MELVAQSLLSIGMSNKGRLGQGPISASTTNGRGPIDTLRFNLPLTPQTSDAESDFDLDHSSNDGSIKVDFF